MSRRIHVIWFIFLVGIGGSARAAWNHFPPPDGLIVHHVSDATEIQRGHRARALRRTATIVPLPILHSSNRIGHSRVLEQEIEAWRQRPGVIAVEPNYYGRFAEVEETAAPTDPLHASQWWLDRVGARTLWSVGKGQGITVAVIDSGVDSTHPDLKDALLLPSFDFGNDDDDTTDLIGHGTAVAGIIAARANNGEGVSGISPEARVLPIKISPDDAPVFSTEALVRAIDYAVTRGVQIINLSLVVEQETLLLRQAIRNAIDCGIVVVAAAGNGGNGVAFPASMEGVIAVAATSMNGVLLADSNRGTEIAVAAPGEEILTTDLDGRYTAFTGTSYAAPIATGGLAALMSANPSVSPIWISSLLASESRTTNVYPFGELALDRCANLTIPSLSWSETSSMLALDFSLPPYDTPVDLYIGLDTPFGDVTLRADCSWHSVQDDGYRPIVRGYRSELPISGKLLGAGGLCDSVSLRSLPYGSYRWRIGATFMDSAHVTGAIGDTVMNIFP